MSDAQTPSSPTLYQWFYVDAARQQQGPLNMIGLQALLAAGQLHPGSLVWRDGMEQWQAIGSLDEFIALSTTATPPQLQPDPLPAHASIMPPGAAIDRDDIVYAGFWRRAAAWWLDSMLLSLLSYILMFFVFMLLGIGGSMFELQDPDAITAALMPSMLGTSLLMLFVQAAYFAWMHSRPGQATLGKMAVGIKATLADGGQMSFWRGFGRYFALILGCLPLYLGVLIAGFTERKRALHDMLCDTVVVDRWAFTNQPQRQKRGLDAVTITLLVLFGLFGLLMTGLMVLVIAAAAGNWST
ncbi:RDD family protein [Luteimonas sp. e5]